MKLVKIGRAKTCTIVLPSDKVSSLHAELLIKDNGEYYIEDKNSLNGTFVGGKRIEPNTQIQISRGDLIRFADTELNWAFVPMPDKRGDFKEIYNIGTHHFNDILIDGAFASRFHAILKIAKNGKAYIRDVGSKNGTIVNGAKIEANKDVRIKRNCNIVCGDTDVTSEIKSHIPNPFGWLKYVAAVLLLAGIGLGIWKFIDGPVPPSEFRPSVVYVMASYHFNAILDDNPIPEVWDGVYQKTVSIPYQATAFFIDREGHMATNRHVAEPWSERDAQIDNEIKQYVAEALEEELPVAEVRNSKDLMKLQSSKLGVILSKYAFTKARSEAEALSILKTLIKRIRNSSLTISGEIDYIRVGYPGRYYTHDDEFDRCHVVATSNDDNQDIAILQLNTKKTPELKYILELEKFRTSQLEPLKETFYTIGYPAGLSWGLDHQTRALEPEIRELKCGKMPSKYSFEFQGESIGGASGSPIFDKKGYLVGVVFGRNNGASTFGHACQAKYLKDLYEKEVGIWEK